MSDLLKKAVSLGWGLAVVSKEKIEAAVDELVQKGQLAPEQSKALVNQLVERGEEEQASFSASIQDMVKRKLQDFDVAAGSDLIALKQRVMMLEQRVAALEGADPEEPREEDGQPNMETDGRAD
ncbi:hypothetical protein QJQ58_26515 [Paenibacillus dendritiformis]|uniref:phasin family protein n=1 Tax=Paenibacillus TaxID=44249 RepID=UPI0010596BDD|nr:hypothetical protein [Paenibacillus dendritiformis]TDL58142.1 hypothetical protein E2R60_06705 [Paenibacillus dendritiformis]WGU94016.1 hypothetical protein QJQ58_26515 [Paenibacillus dendritiformis]